MRAWIPAFRARDRLRELEMRPDVEAAPEYVRELHLAAYGDEDLADRAAAEHLRLLQRREHERGDGDG